MTFHNNRAELNALMERHGFRLSKGLGQNLLIDGNIIRKIVDSIQINKDELIVEVGPGLGALTLELCEKASSVISVEIDKRIIPILNEITESVENLKIENCDFLDYNLNELEKGYKIVGNLPYYITSPIIMKLVESDNRPSLMIFMIQKEVAQRITAKPGSKVYGSISVACQYNCEVEYLFDVSKEVFLPKPKVDSAVIRLKPFEKGNAIKAKNEKLLFDIIKAGFGQRRKMLRNSLQNTGIKKEYIDAAFEKCGLESTERAESLSVKDFVSLADALDELQKQD